MTGPTVSRQIPHLTPAVSQPRSQTHRRNPGPSSPNEPGGIFTANLKGGELANCAGASDSLVVGFLTHTGLSLNNEPSP